IGAVGAIERQLLGEPLGQVELAGLERCAGIAQRGRLAFERERIDFADRYFANGFRRGQFERYILRRTCLEGSLQRFAIEQLERVGVAALRRKADRQARERYEKKLRTAHRLLLFRGVFRLLLNVAKPLHAGWMGIAQAGLNVFQELVVLRFPGWSAQ